MAGLVKHVALFDAKGKLAEFGPGDDIPEWARKKITNPAVWDEDYEPDSDDDEGPPPKSGKGSGIRAWRVYAMAHGVDPEGLDEAEIVAELQAAGVPVE